MSFLDRAVTAILEYGERRAAAVAARYAKREAERKAREAAAHLDARWARVLRRWSAKGRRP